MNHDCDVVIVGAGFAGITAARELTKQGASVVVLEARDRIGGRAWFRESDLGRNLEIGGTWVHWIQPHVWAEITRYGLELVSSPEPERAYWRVGDDLRTGTAEEMLDLIDAPMAELLKDSRDLFAQPYASFPLTDAVKAVDDLSVTDRIAEQGLDPETRALMRGMWALNFSGDPTRGAYTQALRWCALSGGDWRLMFEACATYKLATGTRSLIEAIAADAQGADIRLDTAVTRIVEDADGVIVTSADGSELRSRRVVVTVPINILTTIDVQPPLPGDIVAVAAEGQTSSGIKVWARVRGKTGRFAALSDDKSVFTYAQYEYPIGDDSLVVAFGPQSGRIDLNDPHAVEAELRAWLPDVEVVAVDAHDWTADPLAGETWPMLAPGQLDAVSAAAHDVSRHIRLAGSDYACGWAGFIDGAIESGMQAARRITTELEEDK
ncbi:flavin monoamine oxidase family protein [Gordonia polyisoprenivorans]|uniref:flavin monoamine oxidase family protein n=1 Tax=Gordonia polyisoprenivorans TaxID=84595 RepID=UPI0003814D20|nr:NAD(P)/FAD-dependent oxidoreductase [Gordonia polyisoprenivorans]